MIIQFRCDTARPRSWIASAAAALTADHHVVAVTWADTSSPVSVGLNGLFKLEHMFLHRAGTSGAALLDREQTTALTAAPEYPDIIIDFTDLPRAPTCKAELYLRPLYNGSAGEDAVLTAILAGDLPVIDIFSETDKRVIDRGHPSSEVAVGLSGALDTVMIRTMTLVCANLAGQARPPSSIELPSPRRPPTSARSYVLRGLVTAFAKRIYHLVCYAPQWHVGWRFADGGVWQTHDLSGQPWQRLPERPHCFNADPFPITWNDRIFVFFEELDHRTEKGVIAAIEFNDAGPVGEIIPILEEPWHLSYPFLIEDGGQLWMIPESSTQREVNLYRCVDFPGKWERHATLLSGVEFADATITRHNGLYYMFGVTRDGSGGYSDTLRIYYADQLTGPWRPHAQNPIMVDRASARPAGHLVGQDGHLWRPVQDCSHGYGAALGLAEIIDLSPTTFRQVTRHTLRPSALWPGRKLHTLNRSGGLEVIDGSRIQPKINTILFK